MTDISKPLNTEAHLEDEYTNYIEYFNLIINLQLF